MMKRIIPAIFGLLLIARAGFAEIAILPYKVKNPSGSFSIESGGEYSRLLSVAARMSKEDAVISSPGFLDIDLKRLKLDPQRIITADDLKLLGRSRQIDYILIGTLSKAGNRYISESLLYSVSDNAISARFRVKAASLFKLAEAEVNEAFAQYNSISKTGSRSDLDIAFVIDLSYGMNKDWPSVKGAITSLSSKVINNLGINTRIYLVPFSKKISLSHASVSSNSLVKLKSQLGKLHPRSGNSGRYFMKSMEYAVKSIRWRRSAGKIIIIVSNSNVNDARFGQRYALTARKMKIKIYPVSMGALKGKDSNLFERLAEISRGRHYNSTYHQKIFDKDGSPIELYMENGRLFTTGIYSSSWRKGIFKGRGRYRQLRDPFDEIDVPGKVSLNPYNMSQRYKDVKFSIIINKKKLRNNIDSVFSKILRGYIGSTNTFRSSVAKVLLSDGKVSIWNYVTDRTQLAYFRKKKSYPFYFPLGVEVRSDPSNAYGISLRPKAIGITSDYIPAMMKTKFTSLIKKRKYYMSKGLFYPPVWFVNVKVEEFFDSEGKQDIRGN